MSITTADAPHQVAIDGAVRHLVQNYSPKGSRVGWLMMASILVEAWDLYSIAFVLIFIKEQYNPGAIELGLAAAGTQGGALIGAIYPTTHFMTIARGTFSKALQFQDLTAAYLPLLVSIPVLLVLGTMLLKKQAT